jgi:hypothetical protein
VHWPIFPQKHDVHGPKTLIIFRAADFRVNAPPIGKRGRGS